MPWQAQLLNAAKRLDLTTAFLLLFVAYGAIDIGCEFLDGMSARQAVVQLVTPAVERVGR